MNTTVPFDAPLGSAVELAVPLEPPDVRPSARLRLKPTVPASGCASADAVAKSGTPPSDVPDGVGVPATNGFVTTGGPLSLTSSSGNTGCDGNGAPVTNCAGT